MLTAMNAELDAHRKRLYRRLLSLAILLFSITIMPGLSVVKAEAKPVWVSFEGDDGCPYRGLVDDETGSVDMTSIERLQGPCGPCGLSSPLTQTAVNGIPLTWYDENMNELPGRPAEFDEQDEQDIRVDIFEFLVDQAGSGIE